MQLALGSETLKQITGSQNIDPEYFYEDEDFIAETTENIIKICNKVLMRSEFVNSRTLNTQCLLIEQAFYEFTNRDLDKALHLKERVVRLSNIFVSGLMNSIDNDALGRSLAIVRGVLNIGLEVCLLSPDEYGLNLEDKASEVDKSISCIQLLGPEYLFHLVANVQFDEFCFRRFQNQLFGNVLVMNVYLLFVESFPVNSGYALCCNFIRIFWSCYFKGNGLFFAFFSKCERN